VAPLLSKVFLYFNFDPVVVVVNDEAQPLLCIFLVQSLKESKEGLPDHILERSVLIWTLVEVDYPVDDGDEARDDQQEVGG
jgi:hypothetical protein